MSTKVEELEELLPQLDIIEKAIPLLGPQERRELLGILEKFIEALYKPHHEAEREVVFSDVPRRVLIKGSEGSGKSVAGIVKDLDRLRRGMSGLMASPNLPHFQRSLWKEFQRWCPWDYVIPSHRRMASKAWTPVRPFDIVFENDTYLHCVGARDVGSLEGPNLSFVHFDEARHFPDASAVKVLDGRIRIDGPLGEPPQMWFTTTPRMNWLYEYFGPLICKCPTCGPVRINVLEGEEFKCPKCGRMDLHITDPYADFKSNAKVITLHVRDNEENLTEGFTQLRAESLTASEARVLIDAEWEEESDVDLFLPEMVLWDRCKEDLPPPTPYEPVIVALDASEKHDTFAMIGVSRHPRRPRMTPALNSSF